MKVTIDIDGEEQTFELPDETVRDLTAIANRSGLSLEAALQQAIANEKFLEDQQANGAKLLIEQGNKLRELVRQSDPA